MEKTNRGTVAADERGQFADTIRKGKAVSAAREAGYELINQQRLGDLLADLRDEGLLAMLNSTGTTLQQDDNLILNAAERGMEILRG